MICSLCVHDEITPRILELASRTTYTGPSCFWLWIWNQSHDYCDIWLVKRWPLSIEIPVVCTSQWCIPRPPPPHRLPRSHFNLILKYSKLLKHTQVFLANTSLCGASDWSIAQNCPHLRTRGPWTLMLSCYDGLSCMVQLFCIKWLLIKTQMPAW